MAAAASTSPPTSSSATEFLEDNPDVVKKLLEGHVAAIDFIKDDPQAEQSSSPRASTTITGKPIAGRAVTASFKNLEFTNDPIASSLGKSAKDAEAVGLLDPVDLKGIYDLKLLNQVLKRRGRADGQGRP